MSVRLAARVFSVLCAGLAVLALSLPTRAEGVDVELASKIILKIMVLDLDLQKKTGGQIEIGVIGSPQALAAFRSSRAPRSTRKPASRSPASSPTTRCHRP
jgi:hypothetical protein